MTLYLQSYPVRHMARRWAAQPRSLNVNVSEEDEAYVLSALVPGLTADDLNIQVLCYTRQYNSLEKKSGVCRMR